MTAAAAETSTAAELMEYCTRTMMFQTSLWEAVACLVRALGFERCCANRGKRSIEWLAGRRIQKFCLSTEPYTLIEGSLDFDTILVSLKYTMMQRNRCRRKVKGLIRR